MTSKARPVDPVVADDSVGMSYLNRTPQRLLTVYLPLGVFCGRSPLSLLLDDDYGPETQRGAQQFP